MKTFKTKAGTELPILDLRGKPYLQVAHRLVWFREEHPDWSITTQYVETGENHAIAKATITDAGGRVIATGHKCEDRKGFADFIEKAETGAIGRALAACGYGTQFAPDLDEGERLADAPVQRPKANPYGKQNNALAAQLNRNLAAIKTNTDIKQTEKSVKDLWDTAKKNGWNETKVHDYLQKLGLESTRELNNGQYDALMKNIISFPVQP